MLPEVKTPIQKLEPYRNLIPNDLFNETENLAKQLRGLKVIHINSTPRGGGVAEILKSLVPLMKGVGLSAEWHVVPPREKFFQLTKQIHNALQGKQFSLSPDSRKLYRGYTEQAARMMQDMEADIWIIHDPQPVGLVQYLTDTKPLISRVHIDTTAPNPETWNFIKDFLLQYDQIIFHCQEFIHNDIPKQKVTIMPPAIDSLTKKNQALPDQETQAILKSFGVKVHQPLVAWISRFDPWKDPLGTVEAYRLAKKEIPNLQLALIGLFLAKDDPQAMKVFKKVEQKTKSDSNIFLFSDPEQLGSLKVDTFVNAFQTGSDIILQKSIREGFNLSVTEAMWKEKPVIGGNVGGIKLQIEDGKNGFLVSSPEQAAKRIVQLINDSQLRKELGQKARRTVKRKFLIPRLLRDYLKLFKELSD